MRRAIDLLVIENGRMLLVRKKQTWILPGGKPEVNESDLKCLQREIKEELGTDSIVENFYGFFIGETPNKKDFLQARVYFGRLGSYDKLIQREGDSISEAKFVDNPHEYNLSNITKGIVNSLIKDGYLK